MRQSKSYSFGLTILWVSLLSMESLSNAQSRSLGLDISAWQGNITQTTWSNFKNVENRDFVYLRSSRGGTTGYYNQNDPSNSNGQNRLSQRYDDHYFVQNINRATTAGMFAGAYHFSRPDVVASTSNSGGIANTGTDEADHFMQMAGAWMRPGYLMPVHDLEAGDQIRSDNGMAQFAIEFSDRMYDVMGIRPAMYLNGNYANFVIGGASNFLQNQVVSKHPDLWSARWPNQSNPNAIPVQTGHPKDSYAAIYGPWDNAPNPTHPWSFWQYASTGRLNSFKNGNGNLDFNVAQGGIEFLKDKLVPAVWMTDSDGQWTTLANWNSGQAPVAPIQGPGQIPRAGSLTLPTARLPAADDTVILDRGASVVVNMTAGNHSIRKLIARESLNISGGSLTVNYIPSADSTPLSVQVSAAMSVVGNGSLIAHTLQVDAGRSLELGSSLTFNTLRLQGSNTNPATLDIVDDVVFNPLGTNGATVESASTSPGFVDLNGAYRKIFVSDLVGEPNDLSIEVPIANGTMVKTGDGTLSLASGAAYGGDIIVQKGTLQIAKADLIADARDVFLSDGSSLALGFSGNADTVGSVYVAGVALPTGIWGGVNSGAQFTSPFFTGTGTLQVTSYNPLLSGDYNTDGVVDAADFTLWRDSLGATGISPFSGADGNGDGSVTSTDFDVWKDNFGETSAAILLVPEPHPMWICWFGLAGFLSSCRRLAHSSLRPRANSIVQN